MTQSKSWVLKWFEGLLIYARTQHATDICDVYMLLFMHKI